MMETPVLGPFFDGSMMALLSVSWGLLCRAKNFHWVMGEEVAVFDERGVPREVTLAPSSVLEIHTRCPQPPPLFGSQARDSLGPISTGKRPLRKAGYSGLGTPLAATGI